MSDMPSNMRHDTAAYLHYTGPQRLEKTLHSLQGLLQGVAADAAVSKQEITAIRCWMDENNEFRNRHPFDEVYPVLDRVLEDGFIDQEELADVLWLCERMEADSPFFYYLTSELQRFHGVLGGISADGVVTEAELIGLTKWMEEHALLRGCYPFDEVESLISAVMCDKKIDKREQLMLQAFFTEFVCYGEHRALEVPLDTIAKPIAGICSTCPAIVFEGRSFCFTGSSRRMTRKEMTKVVEQRGGLCFPGVTLDLDYLVIGADGNPAWAFACYGRKVEKAMEYRKQGRPIVMVHELDFWDAAEE